MRGFRNGLGAAALAALVAAVAAGCGDGSGLLVFQDDENLDLAVTAGTTPTYTWTGGGARSLTVTQAGGGQIFWQIEALDTSVGFASGVTHGAEPSTAQEVQEGVILQQGVDYTVRVTLVSGAQGSLTFRP